MLQHILLQFAAGHGKRQQIALAAQFGEFRVGQHFIEAALPPVKRFVAHFRAHIIAADHRPFHVIALLFGGGNIGQLAGQALFGKHGQHAHFARFDVRPHFGNARAHHLNMVAQHRSDRFAAALKRHVSHVFRVDAGGFGQHGGLHPVLSAHAAARAEAHFFRVGFQRGHQIGQRFIR